MLEQRRGEGKHQEDRPIDSNPRYLEASNPRATEERKPFRATCYGRCRISGVRTLFLPALALTLLAAGTQDAPPVPIVRRWISAVMEHRPGVVDRPLLDMAAVPAETFKSVANDLEKTLRQEFRDPEARNDVRRCGALLHMDIALLLPEAAAVLKATDVMPPPRSAELDRMGRPVAQPVAASLLYFVDGRYVASDVESGHWPFASQLLAGIPDASSDEFVRLWYRAVAAAFLRDYRLANASYHMRRATEVLTRDPIMLLYAGALHETLASGRVRALQAAPAPKVQMTMGQMTVGPDADAPTEKNQLQASERYLRDAVKYGATSEAGLRLGRVLGRLGKHTQAVQILVQSVPPPGDSRQAYFRELFLGTEYATLGQAEDARKSFERAQALYPTAQTPLIALSNLERRSGNRDAALDALRRLEGLPADASHRTDPWWGYYASYAGNASQQLDAVRAWVSSRGRQ